MNVICLVHSVMGRLVELLFGAGINRSGNTLCTVQLQPSPLGLGVGLGLMAWALAGCAIIAPEQLATRSAEVRLDADQTVSQTFVARHHGLTGWRVFLAPGTATTGQVRAELRADDLAEPVTATLPVTQIKAPGFYEFVVAPQIESRGRYYTLTLDLNGEGALEVGNGPENAYLDGALHLNGQPMPGQMAFMLTYDPLWGSLSFALMMGEWLTWLILGMALFVLPGWWLLRWVWPAVRQQSVWVQAVLGMGVGVSIMLAVLVALKTLGWPVAWILPWVSVVASGVWTLGSVRHAPVVFQRLKTWWAGPERWGGVALIAMLMILVVTRLWPIRNLEAPLWDDSYQHTMMAQLIINANGLPDSWEPYYRYSTFSLHFAFSAWVAFWMWLTGHDVLRATLIVGQLANLAGLLALFPLAVRLTRNNLWAGVLALALAGLVSALPGGYMNWGRFPQLAGQIVMPVALWFSLEVLEARTEVKRLAVLSGLIIAGSFFAYYRIVVYYAVFMGLAVLVLAWRNRSWPHWGALAGRLAGLAVVAGVVILPWALVLASNPISNVVSRGITQQIRLERVIDDYRAWERVLEFMPLPVWLLGLPAWLWSLARRNAQVAGLGLAAMLLAAVPAGQLINLPGANTIQSFAVIIFLYVPLAIVFAWGVVDMWQWLGSQARWVKWSARLVLVTVVMGAMMWGLSQQINILQTRFVLVTRPDLRAMTWIRAHLPAEANFLVQAFSIRNAREIIGADAGWYMPLLTGRTNHVPPQYTLFAEAASVPNYTRSMVETVNIVYQNGVNNPITWQRLCVIGVTHVYSGQGRGKVGIGFMTHPDERPLFTKADFQTSPVFKQVYQADLVEIYAFDRGICP